MSQIFGMDIAALVGQGIQSSGGLLNGQMIVRTAGSRSSNDLTAGLPVSESVVTFQGIYEDFTVAERESSLVQVNDRKVLMIAYSFSQALAPRPEYDIVLENERSRIIQVLVRDPASAHYVVHVRVNPETSS